MDKQQVVLRTIRGVFGGCWITGGKPSALMAPQPLSFVGAINVCALFLVVPLLILAAIAGVLTLAAHGLHLPQIAQHGFATSVGGLVIGETATVEMKKLHDDLSAATIAFREANDKLEAETKRFGNERAESKALVDKLNGRLDELEVKMQRAKLGAAESRADKELERNELETKRFNKFARGGEDLLDVEERKALSTDSEQDGGYINFPNLSARIIKKLILVSPFRSLATIETISKGNSLSIPAEGTTNFDAGRVGQRSARPATATGTLRLEEIPTHEYYAAPQLTQQQIDDSAVDVESWSSDRVGTRFAQITNADYINGTGVNMPEGVNTNASIAQIVSGAAALLTMDGMFDLMAALPTYYALNASIICNRKTTYALRKLKDSQNRYLWEPSPIVGNPPAFDSKPVIEMPDMPDIAANAFPVMFGDFKSGVTIVDRQSVRLLRDPYTNKPFVILYFTLRTGAQVTLAEAIVKQKIST
jgi:HK97 family phage major capsid protein